MNNKMKKDLLIVGVSLACFVLMGLSYFLGGIMSPLLFLIIYLVGFNLVLLPIVVNKYYNMYEMENPGWKSFIPLYNATLISSESLAIISYFAIVANVVSVLLVANTWIFEFLGDKWFFIISDNLPLVLMLTVSAYYIISGVGLMSPLLKIRDTYFLVFRDSDEISSGFARFLMSTGNLTKYLEVLLLMLPVFRIVPMYFGYCRAMDMTRFNVSFLDFE